MCGGPPINKIMKSVILLSLIPYVFTYGGKPRKEYPRVPSIEDDYEPIESDPLWKHDAETLPHSELWGNDYENLDNGELIGDSGVDSLDYLNQGKPRKARPRTSPVNNDDSEMAIKPPQLNWESVESFEENELSPLEEDLDRPDLKVTVPLQFSGELGSSFGIFPKQEISYKMGTKVLTGDVAVYIIYYGSWTSQQKGLLNDFTSSLGDSSKCFFLILDWWNIMRKYYSQKDINSKKIYVEGKLKLAKWVDDNYSMGRNLEKEALPHLIRTHVKNGYLPHDSTGIYLVLTSDDVEEEFRLGGAKMCRDYCGYHITGNFDNGDIFYYAMVGFYRLKYRLVGPLNVY